MKNFCKIALLLLVLTACTEKEKQHYKIGVSQCSADIWREKQNSELRMGAYCHEGVELCFAAAYDSDERQVQQIDSLVATGIDLLIVAPNQVQTISPAIDRAYDSGIPVIVFERKTSSKKYTAYMGADNYEMGRVMGKHIATSLQGKGNVLEVMGLEGSSPAIERHNGFADALADYPDIKLVASLQGDWTEQSAYEAVMKYEGMLTNIDYVFGQNDRMAMGARRAISSLTPRLPRFCGIDGLPGEGGGMQLVRDSVLDATYIYPTHGDRLLEQALDILDGKPYEKENMLMSALVTPDNVHTLLMLNDEIQRRSTYLNSLEDKSNDYLRQLATQRTIIYMAIGSVVMVLVIVLLLWLYRRRKTSMQRQRVVSTLWNMDDTAPSPATDDSPDEAADSTTAAVEQQPSAVDAERRGDAFFITRFKTAVEQRLSDSSLSVEDLAADMNLSRVQLYRKVKASTGSTPNELLRTARLNRGYQLLLTTDKTISEVAYAVGFTAPSYFTKCFKDEFGKSPTEMIR